MCRLSGSSSIAEHDHLLGLRHPGHGGFQVETGALQLPFLLRLTDQFFDASALLLLAGPAWVGGGTAAGQLIPAWFFSCCQEFSIQAQLLGRRYERSVQAAEGGAAAAGDRQTLQLRLGLRVAQGLGAHLQAEGGMELGDAPGADRQRCTGLLRKGRTARSTQVSMESLRGEIRPGAVAWSPRRWPAALATLLAGQRAGAADHAHGYAAPARRWACRGG